MIDPLVSLGFSLHANKGAYALLLGSGASRSAGIPTGWEITLELVKRIAASCGADCLPSAEQWFQSTYGRAPDYSDLLDQLCRAPSERQQYLKPFFEPNAQEREEGLKAPTPAHHAVAELMAQGYVRVVLTTNFDRLLEQALEARGIVPVVIANADQARGMLPLVHQKHCIVKVHGDYLDTRIMNTESELAGYAPEMDRLLDQIFDEFGLILCGWSGAWDPALRSAITRAPSRRFSSYWAVRGAHAAEAETLCVERGILSIPIDGADSFFVKLAENLTSLRAFDRPHPLSVQAAVASLKRYLPEDRYRIRLHDLLVEVTEQMLAQISSSTVLALDVVPDDTTIVARVKAYDAAMEILLPMALELGRWVRGDQIQLVGEVLRLLATNRQRETSRYTLWQGLSLYPATLFLYGVGLSLVKVGNYDLLGQLLRTRVRGGKTEDEFAVAALFPTCIIRDREHLWPLFDGKQRYTPLSDWLEDRLRALIAPDIPKDGYRDSFAQLFDEFELLAGVVYRCDDRKKSGAWEWVPYGCWAWRDRGGDNILDTLRAELDVSKPVSRLMQLDVFTEGEEEARAVMEEVRNFQARLNMH